MVVSAADTWGSIGGGNLEAVAVERARAMLEDADRPADPVLFTVDLSDKAPVEYGVQCCGGRVTVLLEPQRVVPAVAIFGLGHVGVELARILSRHELDLHLVDSRPERVADPALAALAASDGQDRSPARVQLHHVAVLPELVLGELPAGCHVLVMTHDHAEDAALVDAALRTPQLGSIGLIGSSAKWTRFRSKLVAEGHSEHDVARVVTPIGIPGLAGKEPAVIAVSVAAALLQTFQDEQAPSTASVPEQVRRP
jgi:xanthine dehydrogenase accessory factor